VLVVSGFFALSLVVIMFSFWVFCTCQRDRLWKNGR